MGQAFRPKRRGWPRFTITSRSVSASRCAAKLGLRDHSKQKLRLSPGSRLGFFVYIIGRHKTTTRTSTCSPWPSGRPPPARSGTTIDNETELPIAEHTSDTTGYTDLVFSFFDLLGLQFSPRLRDWGDQKLYRSMPGGWTMAMAWMRMPGQTWPGAAASFLGMWVVMMVFFQSGKRSSSSLQVTNAARHGEYISLNQG